MAMARSVLVTVLIWMCLIGGALISALPAAGSPLL